MTEYLAKITFASRDPAEDVARHIQDLLDYEPAYAGLSGSLTECWGFGEWGVEPAITLATYTTNMKGLQRLVFLLLEEYDQLCAYVELSCWAEGVPVERYVELWSHDPIAQNGVHVKPVIDSLRVQT
ncbi:MAG: hypothetical protein AMS18_00315 [Gemmatimonas sp. SG8_17]|nr:MAG: hypothetical protein AMS18_00315 [Gemmatimonas sp. SG8_17]